jgi:ribosomal protein S10
MIKTGNPLISIYTEMTPNPETMKFVANKLLYPGKSVDFQDESQAGPSPLAKELFSFPFIKSVFIARQFCNAYENCGHRRLAGCNSLCKTVF